MSTDNKKIGAVMVVGGGVGGMQAALDLVEAGIKVYLVDNKPCIGGVMAMLDKTFPTNDCAMCIMAPRLVEVGRHKDIEVITLADVESVEGVPGDFKVTLRKRARYVDEEKCTGCGECAEACPIEVPSEHNMNLDFRKAIYRPYPQAVPNTFSIEKVGTPPCRSACPAGVNVQGFIALTSKGKFAEALALYKERNPFPATCGRICHHPCEEACNREEIDEPLAVRALHRFLADLEIKNNLQKDAGRQTSEVSEPSPQDQESSNQKGDGQKVAIVGSGPAGLTAAWDLARMGHKPVVFEALPAPGGMLRVGIPRYRLPEEILDYEIEAIKRAGVEIRTNSPIGPDLTLTDLFNQGYKAIFIAIGAHGSRKLRIEGEELQGVIHGVGFLRKVKLERPERLDGKVVAVVGGGNAAMDSVRTALRLGARKVLILYRRSRKEMPASEQEIQACEEEGVEIHYLVAPKRIVGKGGRVTGVECIRMKLGPPDESGRRRPVPIEGSEFSVDADMVIPAISQEADLTILSEARALEVTKDGVLPTEGVELEGVRGFTDFLKAAGTGQKVDVGEKVVVIGGGNVALDVARTALHVGGKEVHLACLEKRKEMPAFKEEVELAKQEGVIIHNSVAPKRIVGKEGKAVGVEFLECISVFDREGKFSPRLRERTEQTLPADTVIVAKGQRAQYTLLKTAGEFLVTKWGWLLVDEITLATDVPGIFAGGDVIGGPGVALQAVVDGHEAAVSIDRFLRGEDPKAGRERKREVELARIPDREVETKPRARMPLLPVEKRIVGFDEVELGFDEKQAIDEAKRCLNCGICSECLKCVEACEAEAIDHSMPPETLRELQVGAIILSPGYDLFDAGLQLEFGYLRYPNVITALEFERILSASGPYSGQVLRPSDNTPPKKIAFVQCLGSRDAEKDYCSSVCCMYATKEAIIAKEHVPGLECNIFFIDLRAFGKGFDDYYERAKKLGVNYIRCRPSSIEEMPDTGSLRIQYLNGQKEIVSEEYGLVVLSVGLQPPKLVEQISQRLGIELNQHGFCRTGVFSPVKSSREGIFVCGPFTEPKDIPETVTQASAAAAKALNLLCDVRGTLIKRREYPPEKDVAGKPPRIGVFVCHCGTNIAGVINVPEVVEYAKTLPSVVYVENNLYTCSNDTQHTIKKTIEEQDLNGVVVASCTPRTHEPLFRNTVREAGLNPYLFEMANIRDQCSWVHTHEPELATHKAKDLVRMAVARAALLEPLESKKVDMNPSALVIGGGLSGITAALELSGQGFEVHLIEKDRELGGNLRRIHFLLNGEDPQEQLASLVERIERNDRIHLYTDTQIKSIEGFLGNFRTKFASNGGTEGEVPHGVIIVATGAQEYQPTEYLYGQDQRIMTQLELEGRLGDENFDAKNVAMIQCVGSRDEERPYCSRVCCSEAVKNALKIREISPGTNVYIFYRDMRTYGFRESYYRKAREKGVVFIRYEEGEKPQLAEQNGLLRISAYDSVLDGEVSVDVDLVVLSAATVPHPENRGLAQMLKIPLNLDGFFLEAHMKLRPVDFATEGVFLCGLAHSAKSVEEAIAQASGAAARAATLLSKAQIEAEAMIPVIDQDKCVGCGVCESLCAYEAIMVTDTQKGRKAEVTSASCKGCGSCAAACPQMANMPGYFTDQQLTAQIAALAEGAPVPSELFRPKVLAFLCNWCSYAGADLAGVSRIQYQPDVRVIRVMCSGRVDPALIIEAFLRGIDGVLILGCHPGDCHYSVGNLYTEKRMKYLNKVIENIGLEPGRLRLDWVSAAEAHRFSEIVNDFTTRVKEMGPICYEEDASTDDARQKLRTVKLLMEDARVRALVAKEKTLIEQGDIYGQKRSQEEFDRLVEEVLSTELNRKMILLFTGDIPLSVEMLSKKMGLPPSRIFRDILVLRRKGLVQLEKIEANHPFYKAV